MLDRKHAQLLDDRGVDVETAARFGVKSSDKLGGDCIAIPYLVNGIVVNHKYRTLGERKEFMQDKGATKCLWNFDAISERAFADMPLIICEGEMDALIAIQCGYPRATSVPDGAPAQAVGDNPDSAKYEYLDHAMAALRDVREIILAVDSDAAGVNLLNDLALRLGKARCKWVRYPKGCKDFNDAFRAYGERGVRETILRAQYMRVQGIYRMSELPPIPQADVFPIGMCGLDKHYRVRLGDFVVVTGIPSHGKTSFITEISGRLVESYGWNVCFASFEQKPQVDHRRALRTFRNGALVIDQGAAEIAEADGWIDQHFSFIVPDEDDEVNLEWTLERCAASVIRYGAKVVVIDPWNEMDHVRPRDMSLTEYTGFAIKQFRKLATKYNVHVIVAAHPTKQAKNHDGTFSVPTLYDISDSSHWYNKADIGIIVHRQDQTKTLIRIAKSRYHDEIGEPGDISVEFQRHTARYLVWEATS